MPVQFSAFYHSLDPDPLKRGKQFEHFVKWFLKTDPEWATQVDQIRRCRAGASRQNGIPVR
ncbi:MAG: hypothetical protein PHD65_08390 [Gallionella sp.]|nr:hypothetical protein [Gallionella sp.]